MASIFKPASGPLRRPGGSRVTRRPDLSSMVAPAILSGEPLSSSEIDYDELVVLRSWRSYDEAAPGVVKYFMYELAQRNPGDAGFGYFFKAVRLIRLTRVPRYLRNNMGSAGPNAVFEGQRDILAALREQGVLFTQVIARSPELPLVFAYGVQAVGSTPEEAQYKADESFAVLTTLLDGVYQQLEYAPLLVSEGEALVRYQSEWNSLAIARGRPLPTGTTLGGASYLDGNRTDIESTNNQLEAFIRGMAEKSFMLTLVTVPLAPTQMSAAWRNLTEELSKYRSDQQGVRSISAGVALPIALGATIGDASGITHTAGTADTVTDTTGTNLSHGSSEGVSSSLGINQTGTQSSSFSDGTSTSNGQSLTDTAARGSSFGTADSVTHADGTSSSDTQGTSSSRAEGTGQSTSNTHGTSTSSSRTDGVSNSSSRTEGLSASSTQTTGVNQSQAHTEGAGTNASVSQSQSLTNTNSQSSSLGVSQSQSQSQSVAQGVTNGTSTTDTVGTSVGASQTSGSSASNTSGTNASTAVNASHQNGVTYTDSTGTNESVTGGLSGGGTITGTTGSSTGSSTATSTADTTGTVDTSGTSNSSTNGTSTSNSNSVDSSSSRAVGSSSSASQTNTQGQSQSQGTSATNTVGSSQSATAGQSSTVGVSRDTSNTDTVGSSASLALGTGTNASNTVGVGTNASTTVGTGTNASTTTGTSSSITDTTGVNASRSTGINATDSTGRTISSGSNESTSQAQGSSSGTGTAKTATDGTSQANGSSSSTGQNSGTNQSAGSSASLANARGISDAFASAYSRTASQTGSMGIAPNVGVVLSKTTFNEAKRFIADLLEAQLRRYQDGIEGGAFLYQAFLVCPDDSTMRAGAAAMKAAFWGPGSAEMRLPEAFHTAWKFDPDQATHDAEKARLLTHARAFTSYRKRESSIENISPYHYSSYVTPGELSAMTHPPVTEALGLLAVHDSAPVMALPYNRADRDLYLGKLFHGERGKIIEQRFGIDIDELTHTLITGVTGSGKTTALMRLLEQISKVEKEVTIPPTPENPFPTTKMVKPSILALDWMKNIRDLATVVDPKRFRFYSVSNPKLGELRFNPIAIPVDGMAPMEWINRFADLAMASWGLLDFGRSLVVEHMTELFGANRLQPYTLRPAVTDPDSGLIIRAAITLPAIDRTKLPAGAIAIGPNGEEIANVFTCPELSRCVSLAHMATMVAAQVEKMSDPVAARTLGRAFADRVQSLWRRIAPFAPGDRFADMLGCDVDPMTRSTLDVQSLIDREHGMITVVETEGLDSQNRKLIIGSILLAVYAYGLFKGEGTYDHNGAGPGLFVVAEEANELFGTSTDPDDAQAAGMRAQLWSEVARRSRALGMRLVMVCQNPSSLPDAITSNTSTVIIQRTYHEPDRKRVFDLLNWSQQIGQQVREYRYIGEMSRGMAIVRLDARNSWLESAPVHIMIDSPNLPRVTDAMLEKAAKAAGTSR